MPRLNEHERDAVMNDFNGHYEELLVQNPGWEFEPGFGLTQLRALEQGYRDLLQEIVTIGETTLTNQRAQRDGLFGTSGEDVNGVWFALTLYKKMTRSLLPKSSTLLKTVPLIGVVTPGFYDTILGRFIEHWKLVNAALPPAAPLVIAGKSLAVVEDVRAQIAALATTVDETSITRLAVMRATREQLFGDVIEEEREPTSIVARLQTYSVQVESQFAGTPLAQTLPRIFPGATELPRFYFNFRESGANVILWWTMTEALKNRAAAIYLKEGIFEETRSVPAAPPYKVEFTGAEPQEELDEVELRDADGKTIAHGKRDGSLVEP